MSRRHPTESDDIMLRYRCGRCLAQPGEWCSVQRGGWSTLLHAYRFHRAVADTAFPWQHKPSGSGSSEAVPCPTCGLNTWDGLHRNGHRDCYMDEVPQ